MALADPPPLLLTAMPTVEIDGQAFPLIARNMERLRMTEALGGLSSLELTLTDALQQADGMPLHAAGGDSPLVLGAGARVFAGPAEQGASEIFDGQITAIEAEVREAGAPLFTILAEDRLFPARRIRRTRLFEDMSVGDVIEAVAGDHRLTAEIRDGLDPATRDWMQTDETDLAFLRRLLDWADADMQVVGDRLQVGRIGQDQRALVRLQAGNSLIRARITADIAEQVSEVRVAGFDPATGEPVSANADAAGHGPGSGRSGKDVLAEAFSAITMHTGRRSTMTDAEAQTLAEREGHKRARAFVRVEGSARGTGDLRVGSWVELAGVNPQFANQYAVTHAVHRWDRESGYVTDFTAQSAYLGEAA